MSHLHIPDGILPPVLWLVGLLLMLLLTGLSVAATRRTGPQQIAYQSALGGLMLAVMALPVPVAGLHYCMTLAGPIGVLLGWASAVQVSIVVTVILALLGQGGFTVIGLNAVVLTFGAVLARWIYLRLATAFGPGRAMAIATAISQLLSSAAWVAILAAAVRLRPAAILNHDVHDMMQFVQLSLLATLLLPSLAAAVAVEALLAYGLGGFLGRVRPDLLPQPAPERLPSSEIPST